MSDSARMLVTFIPTGTLEAVKAGAVSGYAGTTGINGTALGELACTVTPIQLRSQWGTPVTESQEMV